MNALAAILLLAAVAIEPARLVAVRVDTVDSRRAVRLLVTGHLQRVEVSREGDEVLLRVGAEAPDGLTAPEPQPPLLGLTVETEAEGVLVRVRVPPEVPYEIQRQATVLSVLFGEVGEAVPEADTAELYQRIFPTSYLEETGAEAGGSAEEEGERALLDRDRAPEGLTLGSVTLRPTVASSYVDGEVSLTDSAVPVRDRYFQVQPRVGAEAPFLLGELRADYEARLRRGSAFAVLDETTHLANAQLEVPLGTRLVLTASDHYARGTLETMEVDPGREYFFGLARFTRNQAEVSARMEAGVRTSLLAGATHNVVELHGPSGFFDYARVAARAGLGFDLTPTLRAALLYGYERVPAPAGRPEAALQAQQAGLSLSGEVIPLLTGDLTVGYRVEEHPEGPPEAPAFRGVTGSASLTRELSPAASVTLAASRATQLSAFEGNPYYVSTSGQVEIRAPLPYSFSLHAGVGHHRNRYVVEAAGKSEPRSDEILGWTVGLGRSFGRRAYLRADYRRERRDSNVDALSNDTESLVVQLGVGFFGVSGQR